MHGYDEKTGRMTADESKCVDCQRCVVFCPTHALQIRPAENKFRSGVVWRQELLEELYRQAETGGVLPVSYTHLFSISLVSLGR